MQNSRSVGLNARLTSWLVAVGVALALMIVTSTGASAEVNDKSFDCSADGGVVSWADADQSKYWIYKSTDGGVIYQWVGRTTGETSFTDPAPTDESAVYQVHYPSHPRITCLTPTESGAPPPTIALPDVIEAEDYFRARDTEPGNQGMATRFVGDVDVWPLQSGDGFIVGRNRTGESTSYKVTASTPGTYRFAISAASGAAGSSVTVRLDGKKIGATTRLAGTGDWWTFAETDLGSIDLAAGRYIVTVQWGDGQSNFDKLIVTSNLDVEAPPTPTAEPEVPPTGSCVVDGVTVQTRLAQSECDAVAALVLRGLRAGDPCSWALVTCNETGSTVTGLDLTPAGASLSSLDPQIGNLRNLEVLDLGPDRRYDREHSDLESLPAEFANLTKLTHLYLGQTGVSSVPGLGNFSDLVHLDINRTEITTLPPEIGNLTNLTHLDMAFVFLTSFPPEMSNLTKLTYLDMSGGTRFMTTLPTWVTNQTDLERLILNNGALVSLSPEVGNLSNLTHLDLLNNNIAALPAEFGNLVSLSELSLGINELTSLPPEFGNLTNLTRFSISDGFNDDRTLSSLPPEIGNLTNLEYLSVSNTSVTSLPAEIGNLRSLTEAAFAGNALTALPPEIGNLTNLEEISIYGNRVTSLPPEFGNLTNLKRLDVSSNRLASLPAEFGNLTKLERWNGSRNDLTALPESLINLISLDEIDLAFNRLRGDISVLAGGLSDEALDVVVGDGAGGNDCLTTDDELLRSALYASDWDGYDYDPAIPWDRCDAPDD